MLFIFQICTANLPSELLGNIVYVIREEQSLIEQVLGQMEYSVLGGRKLKPLRYCS